MYCLYSVHVRMSSLVQSSHLFHIPFSKKEEIRTLCLSLDRLQTNITSWFLQGSHYLLCVVSSFLSLSTLKLEAYPAS